MNILRNRIKKEIIEYIKKNDGAFYGDIVMHSEYSKITVLMHLIDLKKKGIVIKDKNGGKFQLAS